uniref:Senescence domain-containing protein n=1 Tax=Kalanchoe fedtschenkoi TaxID=63787 RepID=A0A7N0V0Y6_KALFE
MSSSAFPNPNSQSNRDRESLYPSLDMDDLLAENLFPDINHYSAPPSAPPEPQTLHQPIIALPGAILHLIDKQYSVQLASGDFTLTSLTQDGNVIAVLALVGDDIQWPLTKDQAIVKLDHSHYFFSFCGPSQDPDDVLSYGLTFASRGQESLLTQLDQILEHYCSFSVQRVADTSNVLDTTIAKEMSPSDLKSDTKKRELMEKRCAAYWTTLAPNVDDYSGTAAKMIAAGSGQLIKGILWCGDVTVDRLKWGNEVMLKRMSSKSKSEVSPETLKRIKRVKRMTKMTEKVANGVLSGVVKVSGFFSSSVANSKVGKKFFGLLPGEIVLASLDGFSKVCDAVEVAGKNVMSTSSTVTTGLVSERYGEEAGKATNESLDAAGHAIGTAWAVFKIRKALNPKSVLKPSTLAKTAVKTVAAEAKAEKGSK